MNAKKIKLLKQIQKRLLMKHKKYILISRLTEVYKNLTQQQKGEINKNNLEKIVDLINTKS